MKVKFMCIVVVLLLSFAAAQYGEVSKGFINYFLIFELILGGANAGGGFGCKNS